ncbi:MAG: SDR family oxidoreductase [Myxococcota bacterium]|nr:SDR family oxidoreductase [Myxococcota bacterium]
MKIAVFGGSRGTGKRVLQQALSAGHQVTVFARNPAVIEPHEQVEVIKGDVSEPSEVEQAVKGQEAVIFCVGPTSRRESTPVCTVGIRHVIAAMKQHGVRRLVFLSAWGAGDSRATTPWLFQKMLDLVVGAPMRDKTSAEEVVQHSGLDWVIVRPGGLTDKPGRRQWRAVVGTSGKRPSSMVSREDVAGFLLTQLTDSTYLRQAPVIGY